MTLTTRPSELAELESLASQPAYEAFLEAARALDVRTLEECRADIVLAWQNVQRGVESILRQEALVARLPDVKIEDLRSLPQLVQGLAFAALQMRKDLQASSFVSLFERAQAMRRKLLKAAEALAEAELLLDPDVDALRNRERRDAIEDCRVLAAVFRRNEARIAGRSPVLTADIDEAEQMAAKLQAMLTPGGGSRHGEASARVLTAVEMRDRFWTLLNQRHELLWRCGAWLYGREVDERVPPLRVRPTQALSTALARVEPRHGPSPSAGVATATPPASTTARKQVDPMRALHQKVRFLVRVGTVPHSR